MTGRPDGIVRLLSLIGTVLWAGESQTLWVVFTPDDSADYTCAYATVTINVNPATLHRHG